MLSAKLFLEKLSTRGFSMFSGVPCSLLGPLMERVQTSSHWRYVAAANEGDAVAVASGATLGGLRAAVLMQNSGLGNAINPLTSLNHPYRIPILLMVSLRGDPEAEPDAVQHQLMGRVTTKFLDNMEIPWRFLSPRESELSGVLDEMQSHFELEKRPFALVIRKKTFADGCTLEQAVPREIEPSTSQALPRALFQRLDFLKALVEATSERDILVAGTGYTSRELNDCQDRANHFYMQGSMGCASSLGLGIALAKAERRVIVLDGDAALAMRLGNLTVIGSQAPSKLIHIVFDNGVNESTGGQASPGVGVDFAALASCCGYARVARVARPEELIGALSGAGPAFIQVPVLRGAQGASPRPSLTLEGLAQRLQEHLL